MWNPRRPFVFMTRWRTCGRPSTCGYSKELDPREADQRSLGVDRVRPAALRLLEQQVIRPDEGIGVARLKESLAVLEATADHHQPLLFPPQERVWPLRVLARVL